MPSPGPLGLLTNRIDLDYPTGLSQMRIADGVLDVTGNKGHIEGPTAVCQLWSDDRIPALGDDIIPVHGNARSSVDIVHPTLVHSVAPWTRTSGPLFYNTYGVMKYTIIHKLQ